MLFNSVAFLIFLPLVVLLYYILPPKRRWLLLLAASYFFYGYWKLEYLSLIIFSTLIDYAVSLKIYQAKSQFQKKILLLLSCSVNLGLLFVFKYLGLFTEPMNNIDYNMSLGEHGHLMELKHFVFYALPVGISFYTFQTMSYTIDVYYGRIKPEKNLGKFALFVSFFPQLVAGPIERFSHLHPQLFANYPFNISQMSKAFRLLLYGFFVKMCIADNISGWVDAVYAAPDTFSRPDLWFGTFVFGLQIYADFSGYTLIAQGAALMLGIKLMDNFRTPYLARSINEFWQRWHISLSTWFRDYVYIPLGGNKVGISRWVINIMLVFLISGFWHGANWTFLIWGGIHGLLYLFERFINYTGFKRHLPHWILRPAGVLFTFVIVHIAWIFFRIENLADFNVIWNSLWHGTGTQKLLIPTEKWVLLVAFICLDITLFNKRIDTWLENKNLFLRWSLYLILLFFILAFGGLANHPFIYFQF